jgi:hypothetical protein
VAIAAAGLRASGNRNGGLDIPVGNAGFPCRFGLFNAVPAQALIFCRAGAMIKKI